MDTLVETKSLWRIFVQRKHMCGDYVDLHYYNPAKNRTRSGSITTEDVSVICYSKQGIISQELIRKI